MTLKDWHGKRVAILGFGKEGQAMASYLLAEGADITICDEREARALGSIYEQWQSRGLAWQLGPAYLQGLTKFEAIVRSPGIPLHLTPIQEAANAGVLITSQTKLFLELTPCPVIGVTGTKGKGTTSTLVLKMLEASRKKAHLVGNIGESSIALLHSLTPKHWIVYELSSFQLQDLDRSPHIAVVLGLTIDHQDYHKTPEEYFAAKANIMKFQKSDDAAIFGIDYPETLRMTALTRGQVYHTSRHIPVEAGAYVAGDIVYRRLHGKTEQVCTRQEVALRGEHNLENVTAAVVAASLAGVGLPAIRKVLATFQGLPHRLEFCGEVDGVQYWNNSYGTTPETTIAAIRAFTEPVVLLLGGSDKGLDYTQLGEAVVESTVKTIVGIGLNTPKIYKTITVAAKAKEVKAPNFIEGGQTMTEMLKTARRFAKRGDVILLAPATSSFDRFKNASDRGDQFREVALSSGR